MWVYGLDWAGPGQRQVADACECGNEPSGSVKCGEFLDQQQTSQLFKKDSAPCNKQVIGYQPSFQYSESLENVQRTNTLCSRRASHSSKLSYILLQPYRDSVHRSVGGTDNHGIPYTRCKSSGLSDGSEGTGVKQNSRQRTESPHCRHRYHPRTRSVASV